MVVNGSTFLKTHGKYKKVRPRGRKGRKPVRHKSVNKVAHRRSRPSRNQQWFYAPSMDISETVFRAASNLCMAHAHRLDEITSDDVSTAFKSLPDVIGVPLKTFKKLDGTIIPVVEVNFANKNRSRVIRVDHMREIAKTVPANLR